MKGRSVVMHVSGKVQGVFFRESTRRKAEQLNISGSVRNLVDGRVQIHAQGSHEAIEALISWCAQGPPEASVEDVEVEENELHEMLEFKVLR